MVFAAHPTCAPCHCAQRRLTRRRFAYLLPRASAAEASRVDKPVVFVAGATGRTGFRVLQQLVTAGYDVRAGVRDVSKANDVFAGRNAPAGVGYTGKKSPPPALVLDTSRITPVVCDVTQPQTLAAALGDATCVVSCLGAPESDALNPALPRLIDGEGTIALVNAAKAAGTVKHFVMVSSLGTGKFGWPASILNLFWNVLEHKREAELALIKSGLPFTIVRPGGMERPTDDYEETHGMVLAPADTKFGGQVSRKQVAQLCVHCLSSPALAANKVIEVIAEENVPLRALDRQLEALPLVAGGVPAKEGTVEAFTTKYAYTKSPTSRVLDVLAFGGAAPEVVNCRAAMIAAATMFWQELHGGGTLLAQCDAAGVHPAAEVTAAAIIAMSLPPLLRGVVPKDANLGAFSAGAELLNGRLAMLGLATATALELQNGVPVMTHPLPF
jgi:uncharacterized protein YbjT (DUF2867 family)